MKLDKARLCLDCDEVFEATKGFGYLLYCPKCGGTGTWALRLWLDLKDNATQRRVKLSKVDPKPANPCEKEDARTELALMQEWHEFEKTS